MNRELLPAALSRALQALSLNEECLKLFGNEKTRARGFDPSAVLISMVTGGKFGKINFEDKGGNWGSAEVTGGGSSATITINTFTDGIHAYWNDGYTLVNSHTLLHELGHVFDALKGSGGSAILSPDSFPKGVPGWLPVIGSKDRRGKENDWLVDQKCFNGELGYKKP